MYKKWIEPAKTVSLIFLILLSLVLTATLWFITPVYMEHDNNHITSPKIGDARYNKKSRYQLTGPPILYLHVTGNHYWLTQKNEHSYDALLSAVSRCKMTSFHQIKPTPEQWKTLFQTSYGIEFSFFHDTPVNQVDAFFDQNLGMQPVLANLNRISRIWLFTDENSDQTSIWFISDQEQKVVSANTDISGGDLRNQVTLAEQMSHSPNLIPISTTNKLPWDSANKDAPFSRIIYLPEQPVTVKRYTYAPKEISINDMKLALLQTSVDEIRLKEELIYIWDDLMLTYNKNTKNMIYSDEPNSETAKDNTITTDIVNITDSFMEKHYGWTGNFLLEKYERPEKRNLYTFRLIHDGFPVFWYQNESDILHFDQIQIQAEPSNVNGIGIYKRSLITLNPSPVSVRDAVLPDMKQFLHLLEKKGIPLSSIQRVYPAYQAQPKGKLYELVPVWRVEDNQGKQWMIGGEE